MKKARTILILIALMLTIIPRAAFAEGEPTPTPGNEINASPTDSPEPTETPVSTITPEPTPTATQQPAETPVPPLTQPLIPQLTPDMEMGSVTFSIDNIHRYEGMDRAYQEGYVPAVKDGNAIIVLPLIASGELAGSFITATPQLGDPASSPFVFKNYQITVRRQHNPLNGRGFTVPAYLVRFDLPLKPDRINGVYQVSIDIKGKSWPNNGEVTQSFTTYVTITDGKDPVSNEPVTPEKPTSQPKVILSNYTVNPSPVIAGQEFTAKITLKNTNEKKPVQNMTVNISCDSPNLTLLNDSSTVFIGKMERGATTEMELKYKTDLETPAQKYNVVLTLSYDDADAAPITSVGVVEAAVRQALNVKMEEPQIAKEVNAGDTMPLTIQVMNLGRSKVYNARVELSAPGLLPSGTAFIGNMEAGTAMNGKMDVFVGTMDMSEGYEGTEKYGRTSGTLALVYEDAAGQQFTDSIDIYTTINEPVIRATANKPEEKPETASQWWISIAVGIALLGVLAAALIVRRKSRSA